MTRLRKYSLNIAVLLNAVIFLAIGFSANAQLRPWDSNNEVLIDLSVLGNQRIQPPAPGDPSAKKFNLPGFYDDDLLVPPRRAPRSRLLATRPPLAGGFSSGELLLPKVTLIKPKPRKRTKRRAKPAVRQVAKAPKTSRQLAPEKPKLQPTPKPAPRAPVAVAKAAPKIEPPKVEPPKLTVSAPPPPPAIDLPKPEPKKVEPKPAPKPAVQTPAKKPETELASRPPASSADKGPANINFSSGESKLSSDGKKSLDDIAAMLKSNLKIRMQLLAYAKEPNLSPSKNRRLSLSRALTVRSYLINKGIRGSRIDVRALGNKVPSGLPNRVEMRVLQR